MSRGGISSILKASWSENVPSIFVSHIALASSNASSAQSRTSSSNRSTTHQSTSTSVHGFEPSPSGAANATTNLSPTYGSLSASLSAQTSAWSAMSATAPGLMPPTGPFPASGLVPHSNLRYSTVQSGPAPNSSVLSEEETSLEDLGEAISHEQHRWPLLLLSHGLTGTPEIYTTYGEQLASLGHIVIAPAHTDGSCAETYIRHDNDVWESRHEQVNERVEDMRCILDILQGSIRHRPSMRRNTSFSDSSSSFSSTTPNSTPRDGRSSPRDASSCHSSSNSYSNASHITQSNLSSSFPSSASLSSSSRSSSSSSIGSRIRIGGNLEHENPPSPKRRRSAFSTFSSLSNYETESQGESLETMGREENGERTEEDCGSSSSSSGSMPTALSIERQQREYEYQQMKALKALGERIDFNRVGVVGHSFGGATAVHLVQQDERVKTGVSWDGWMYPLASPSASAPQGKPFMFVNSDGFQWEENVSHMRQWCAHNNSAGGHIVTLKHTNHHNFNDLPFFLHPILSKWIANHTKAWVGRADPTQTTQLAVALAATFTQRVFEPYQIATPASLRTTIRDCVLAHNSKVLVDFIPSGGDR